MDTSKRARTVIAQSRVDPRSLATLAMYFQKEYDLVISSMSGLVNQIVEELRSLVVEGDPEIDVEETLEAYEMLMKLGCEPRRSGKEFLIQQQKEAGVYTAPVSTRLSRAHARRQEGRRAEQMENVRIEAQRLLNSGEINRADFEKDVESEEGAQARRDKELEEQRSELAKPPKGENV